MSLHRWDEFSLPLWGGFLSNIMVPLGGLSFVLYSAGEGVVLLGCGE